MTTIHLRKSVLLFGAVAVSLAMVASGISAQRPTTLERPLSDAMAEALRSPFHSAPEPSGSHGRHPFAAPTAPPLASSGQVGAGASPSAQFPGGPVPAPGNAPSSTMVFVSSALAATVGYFGTLYLAELCETEYEPGRYDGGSYLWGFQESEEARIPCPVADDDLLWGGFLATIPVTAIGATLAGTGFSRSMLGSALGFLGGFGALIAIVEIGGWIDLEGDFEMSEATGMVLVPLIHAAVTTLVANRSGV